ncbi:hypothetical protein B0O80DRAFT_432118 [Mortierella sp. GBAus27b]|nr:hypothetical protein BGX31_002818 [Mortierella sp. GBA43]KAI8362893.1 hypothetical protein B0O80DRAFT_432118 [Mortierella sp. GBAus27b]
MEPTPASSFVQGTAAMAAMHTSRQSSPESSSSSATPRPLSQGHADSSSTTSITSLFKELKQQQLLQHQQLQQQQQQQQQQPSQSQASSSNSRPAHEDLNRCYICFGTDEDSEGRWVKPCQCTLISHEDCLLDWIDKNRLQFAKKQVRCSVCNTIYRLAEPRSLLLNVYSTFDSLVHSAIPYLTFLGLTCSVLITSTTYGAYAVLTVCGTEEGEKLLGSPNPWGWRVWTGLPLIPVILIFSRTKYIDSFMPLIPLLVVGNDQLQISFPPSPAMTLSIMPWVRMAYNSMWSEMVARLEHRWRNQQISGPGVARLGINTRIDNVEVDQSTAATANGANANPPAQEDDLSFFDRRDLGRTIVGALLMPAISSICGSFLGHFLFIRARFPDNFHRNILGGCLFVVLKDLAGLVGTYQELKRKRVRRIREYSEFKDE